MKSHLRNLLLPLAVAAYPILFLYAKNAGILSLADLTLPLSASLILAGGGYGLFYLFQKRGAAASLSMAFFMVLFYLYGFIYHFLLDLNLFPVQHFILLPLVITLGIYAGYFIARIKASVADVIQKILAIVSVALVVFNLAITVPVEVRKAAARPSKAPVAQPAVDHGSTYPDIYYVIFDEYVGFDAMRDYFHDSSINQFDSFLTQNHFFVAEDSQTPTINTLSEMASRLNLHQYEEDADPEVMLSALRDNKVMQVLKTYGYTTVVMNMAFQGIKADLDVGFNPQNVGGLASDEFEQTYLSNNMLSPFSNLFLDGNQEAVKQRDLILYALNRTASLGDVKSPKFVYTHLLLPHLPFIFAADGSLLPPQDFTDWHYYLGQYQYATKLAMDLVTKLLAQSDPARPPVIILQSDEGARNLQSRTADNIVLNGFLQNYPAQYDHLILNALYLPGYDLTQLPTDLPPLDTFEIVLNHYLNAGVTVDPPLPKIP